MLTCEAQGCLSSQNTKIDGKEIVLFPFPEDDGQRQQWLKNCQLNGKIENDRPLHLCELHFEKMSLTESKELKPSAIPTIFNKVEESHRKRKADTTLQTGSSKTPPLKQKKLNEDSHSLVTPPQSPSPHLTDNIAEVNGENRIEIFPRDELPLNGSAVLKSELYREVQMGKKIYRLTIQIDKIYGKPCPRSKKLMALMEFTKRIQELQRNVNNVDQKNDKPLQNNRKMVCAKGGCKLKKSTYNSKPAYQCEHCDKYYITKKGFNQDDKSKPCTICHKVFPPHSLYPHIRTHFICDMCKTECISQVSYDKHRRLHVSTDPLYPYKCHQCVEIFELKEDLRQHYLIVHPTIQVQNTILQVTASPLTPQPTQQKDYRCVSCNITFRNEQAYRNHINSHKKKEGLRCSISETNNIFSVPNPLTGSQIGILRAVKFSCRVCSMEFDNVGEVDKHTRTHLEEDIEEDRKCNICKKSFKTSALLNEHLKNHLSRAHPCPVCPKAFINRTTLKIHLKTHGEP